MPTLAEKRCGGKPGRGSENKVSGPRGSRLCAMRRPHPVYKTCHRPHVLFLPLLLLGPRFTGDRLVK